MNRPPAQGQCLGLLGPDGAAELVDGGIDGVTAHKYAAAPDLMRNGGGQPLGLADEGPGATARVEHHGQGTFFLPLHAVRGFASGKPCHGRFSQVLPDFVQQWAGWIDGLTGANDGFESVTLMYLRAIA